MHETNSVSPVDQPFFSVLIASMGEACLIDALQSIDNNFESDYEVIVVLDDPAAEPNYEKLPKRLRARLRVLHNTQNMGVTLSLNKGLAACRGEIICRLDDDDRFLPERFELVRNYVERYPNADVFTGGALISAPDGGEYLLSVPANHREIVRNLERRNILIHSALNVRNSVLKRVGGYNGEYYYAQDYELYLRLVRQGIKFVGIEKPIVERYEGADSITVQKRRHQSLYSLSALALHHARAWGSIDRSPMFVAHGFIRFATPQFLRRLVRKARSFRKALSL